MNIKNQSVGFYLNVLAALLGIAGIVLTVVSSSVDKDFQLGGLAMLIVLGVVAVILVLVAIYAPNRLGNHNPLTTVTVLGAIAIYIYLFGNAVQQRIMLIAGLFSYNSQNTSGWNVFYVSVAAWVCLIIGALILVVASFLKSVKE